MLVLMVLLASMLVVSQDRHVLRTVLQSRRDEIGVSLSAAVVHAFGIFLLSNFSS
jgi:hypothetical protein